MKMKDKKFNKNKLNNFNSSEERKNNFSKEIPYNYK